MPGIRHFALSASVLFAALAPACAGTFSPGYPHGTWPNRCAVSGNNSAAGIPGGKRACRVLPGGVDDTLSRRSLRWWASADYTFGWIRGVNRPDGPGESPCPTPAPFANLLFPPTIHSRSPADRSLTEARATPSASAPLSEPRARNSGRQCASEARRAHRHPAFAAVTRE